LCIDSGVGLIPWSPMARGFFAKDRKRDGSGETARANSDPFAKQLYFREEDFTIAEHVQQIAKERGVSGSQIALAWVLSKPYIAAPIIGSSKEAHLDQAIAALEIHLTADEVIRLEASYQPHPVLGHS
ncbi:MAG: aldo/keto reductase, partial [Anaerolineales bacterium]|nr:aldo/keto reductase [Anaerolineales bacterium]